MPLTNTEIDSAIPVAGTPSRALTNAALKSAVIDISAAQSTANSKQTTLISGSTIKTINGTSLLGSGDIVISGGGGGITDGDKGDIIVSSSGTVWTADTNIARIIAPLTVSASTALVAATHANRTLIVDTASVVFTHNSDATSGLSSDDSYDIQAIGSGSFTIVAGTGTLISTDGTSVDSSTAVGKRVQLQRVSANTIRSISPTISAGGSGSRTIIALTPTGAIANNQTLAIAATGTIPANTFTTGKKMTVEYFAEFVNTATAELQYRVRVGGAGGQIFHLDSVGNSFAGTSGINGYLVSWALTNTTQRAITNVNGDNDAHNLRSLSRSTLTVDMTVNQTIEILATTGVDATVTTTVLVAKLSIE